MAKLNDTDRAALWAEFMSRNSDPTPFDKHALRRAFDALDDWFDDNASTIVAAVGAETIGDATFDMTGGASEDVWTLTAHGLAVGDVVRFTAVGTGAAPYVVDTDYFVVNVTANLFQLSNTKGGPVIEGTGTEGVDGDSAGTWTVENRKGQDFNDGTNATQKAYLMKLVLDKRYQTGA